MTSATVYQDARTEPAPVRVKDPSVPTNPSIYPPDVQEVRRVLSKLRTWEPVDWGEVYDDRPLSPSVAAILPKVGASPASARATSISAGIPGVGKDLEKFMLTAPTFRNLEGAYLALLDLASVNPEQHIEARGHAAREVIGVGFRLSDPRQRLPYLATRKVNPVFQFAEALWYLAGRRDLEMIGYYAPSMRSSSADGVVLGGSAYGHMLFNPADGDTVSPFNRTLELLRTETDSKRGYLPVFSAKELAVPDNPDMACLAGLHLLVRDGRLHMVCHMRANDLDCGLLSDVFSFTVIQEYAAVQLGLELGHYTHTIGSAHVNDVNAERVRLVLNEAELRRAPQRFPYPAMSAETGPDTIRRLMEHEELLRTNLVKYSADEIAHLDVDAYWQQVILLFEAYRQIQHDETDTVSRDVLDALHPGLRWLLKHKWAACVTTEDAR